MGDLFDDLYAPRNQRYGDDIAPEFTGDPLPDRHGFRYHLATGCRCDTCVLGCKNAKERARAAESKPRPWDRKPEAQLGTLTYDEWKAAQAS